METVRWTENGVVLLTISYFLYSFGYIFLKLASEEKGVTPKEVLFAGNALQTVVLAAVVLQQRKTNTLWKHLHHLLILASFGGCAQYFYQSGVSISNPGNCTLIQSSIPFIGAPVGWLFMRESIPKAFFPCVFVSFLGILTVIGFQPVHTSEMLGYFDTICGLFLTTAWLCYQRKHSLDPFCAAFCSRLVTASIAGAQVSPAELATIELPSAILIAVYASCFLGASVVSTYAISITTVSTTTMMTNVMPCLTYILQFIILGTPLPLKDVAGICITLTAMIVYAWIRTQKDEPTQEILCSSSAWTSEDPELQPLNDRPQSLYESFGSMSSDENSSAFTKLFTFRIPGYGGYAA